jgi:hypothetical protein
MTTREEALDFLHARRLFAGACDYYAPGAFWAASDLVPTGEKSPGG